jgi:heme-degrading monooxygenase HmoA
MNEAHQTWDQIPGVDQRAYNAWAKKAIGTTLQQPGLIEFRAYRNLSGSPQILVVTEWDSVVDWARFAENSWPALEAELRAFATNINYSLWGISPVVPQPLRPAK